MINHIFIDALRMTILGVSAGGPAYIAIWDPSGQAGEYNLVRDIVSDIHDPALEGKFTNPVLGDANDDGKMDVTVVLQMIAGLADVTARRLRPTDVFHAEVDRSMQGDGQVIIADAIRLLRRIVELEPDLFP